MRYLQFLLFTFSVLASASIVFAQNVAAYGEDPLVKIRVLPERGVIQADEELWIGIEQIIEPHWHTYWRNPGDSGAPPRIKWALPEGFSVSEIYWPTPDKIPYGPLLNYGYSDKVVLLQKLSAPKSLPAGEVVLSADIEVLVCKDECIPEFSTHTITLNGSQAAYENNGGYISIAKHKLPAVAQDAVFYGENDDDILISTTVPDKIFSEAELASMEYFPADWGIVDNVAPVRAEIRDEALLIYQARGDRPLEDLSLPRGVIAYTADDGVRESFFFEAESAENWLEAADDISSFSVANITVFQALIFALLGGVILNLMPCVFPVLSMKALSLVKISEKHPEIARLHGLSYTAGVILSFLAIASILMVLKAAGYGSGWGFQLQNPLVVSLLAYTLFLVGLNLSGYFDVGTHFGNLGHKLTQGNGLGSSFFTGALATIVATPCTAPFMAAAIGFALLQPAAIGLGVFAALGFGLALPYLLLSFAPALQKRLPRPGDWMVQFKHFLAFPMFASSIWLVWVLSKQVGPSGVLGVLLGMLALGFIIWLIKVMPKTAVFRLFTKVIIVLALLFVFALSPTSKSVGTESISVEKEMGQMYAPESLEALIDGDAPVFVEMTAAWCITCKVNHAIAINVPSTKKLFKERDVQYVVGDWTNYDPVITEFLKRYGRSGVPIYVYYGPRDETTGVRPGARVLPQVLTPSLVRNVIEDSFNKKEM